MHILCLHQFYGSPDGPGNSRHWTFFSHLVKSGHQITLICNRKHTKQSLEDVFGFVPEGVRVHYVETFYDNQMGEDGRLKAYLHFAWKSFWIGMKCKNVAVVWGVTVPLTTAFIAIWVAFFKRVKCLVEIKDLWPDFPVQMGALKNPFSRRLAYWMEKWVYRNADQIVCTSPDYEAHIRKIAPKQSIETLLLGTNLNLIAQIKQTQIENLRHQYNLEGKKVVLYGGTFGRANAIPELLRVIQILANYPDVVFVFIGLGYYEHLLKENKSPNLLVLPPQSYSHSLVWFSLADLSLISFVDIPVLSTNSPAKFFDSIGCGTPVVVTNKGWTKSFVEKYGCGVYENLQNPKQFAQSILYLFQDSEKLSQMAEATYNAARLAFDLDHQSLSIENHFKNLVSSK